MLCEQILGKLPDFDLSGKTVEYVDIEWHEAFKKIQSSRRKFLLMRNFRPLTPPCVPFGTRRFNQLNM